MAVAVAVAVAVAAAQWWWRHGSGGGGGGGGGGGCGGGGGGGGSGGGCDIIVVDAVLVRGVAQVVCLFSCHDKLRHKQCLLFWNKSATSEHM